MKGHHQTPVLLVCCDSADRVVTDLDSHLIRQQVLVVFDKEPELLGGY